MYFPKSLAALPVFLAAAITAAGSQLEARQAATKITVNLNTKYQTIDGFGFSEAFQRANLIVKLGAEKQKQVLDILFSNTTGAAFSIVRNGIGSTPNSNSDYMNSILPTSPGSPSGTPKYVWDGKDSGQLFISQKAQEYGVKTFYANAWSAPGFMKTNNNDMNGGSLCGVSGASCSSGDWKQAYANYLVQYIKFYQEAGVNVTHLGFLNEPELTTSYASMRSTGQQAADFIKVLYPTLQAANLTSVKITCCDAEGWGTQNQMAGQLQSAGVGDMVGVITSHEYTGRATSAINTKSKVWQTEYADLNGGWTTAWYSNGGAGEGLTWAQNIYTALVNANCNGYLAWVATQGGGTNEKLILINNQDVTVSKRLWAFANWSRFVRPGAVRVQTSGGNLRTSAFLNLDGSVAVQVINTGSAATVNIAVTGLTGKNVTAWITDNTHDLSTTAATIATDGTVSGSVPSRAMVSFVITA